MVALVALVAAGALAAPAHAFVYWSNFADGTGTTIGRASADDGQGAAQDFIDGASGPEGVAVDGAHIYWANGGTHSIGRANLDGSSPQPDFIPGASDPFGVAVDGSHVYWTNVTTDSIGRANLDGSGAVNDFITGASDPAGIAVDGQHVYWVNAFSGFIGRANLDGAGVDQAFIRGINHPEAIALDAQHMYWTDEVDATIGRADLDGSGVDNNFITGASDPLWIAVDGQHIFWTNPLEGTIGRAKLDGSGLADRFITGATEPTGVAVDQAPLGPPAVSGERVLGVGQTSATVGAVVNPNGGPARYHVEWGPTASYGSVGPDLPSGPPLSGQGDQAVAAQLTGLMPSTAYHWRIVASNSSGGTPGADQTLATSAGGPAPIAGFTITPPPVSGARTVLSATGSSGNGSPIVSYRWDWTDDGTFDATCGGGDPVAMPAFLQTGTYHVGLQVTSADGQSAFATSTVTVSHVPTGAAHGAGLVAGYACGSVVHDALCTNHIKWDLIVADALDNGCFTEVPVKPWAGGTTICQVCARDASAGEPVAYAPPSVAGWFHRTDAKTWQATGRVLVNGVIIAPLTQLVGVGDRQGRRFQQRQTSVLINEVDDSIYAASADVSVKGTGRFPDTVLARGATINKHLPVSAVAPPGLFGAGDRPAVVGGSHPRALPDSDQDPNPCEDPGVQALPELAQLGDPTSIGSKISGFPLSGPDPVTVRVVGGQVVVCVDVELPPGTFGPCASGDPFVLKATLIANQNGLVLQDLHAHLPCAVIAGVVFEQVFFDYDAAGQNWSAGGTVEAIPGVSLSGQITFVGGRFNQAIVGLGNSTVPVAPWQLTQAEIEVDPTHTSGTVTLSLWPPIPGLNESLLDVTGGFDYWWDGNHPHPGDPPLLQVSGMASTFGYQVAHGELDFLPTLSPPQLWVHAGLHADFLGVVQIDAHLDGGIWNFAPLHFDFEAGATLSLLDLVHVSGMALVSDNGAVGCVDVNFLPFGPPVWVGVGVHWVSPIPYTMWGNCDLGRERDAGAMPSADVGHLVGRAVGSAFMVPVGRGTRYEVIGATGAGAPPAVALEGPRGQRFTAPGEQPMLGAREVVLHDAATNTTFVIIRKPSAGRWTVSALPGSPQITAVRFAATLPPVSVHARVNGTGHRRTLAYRIDRTPGQVVEFFERGDRWERPIGRVTGGGRGTIHFAPAPAGRGRRAIVAVVKQFGRTRRELTVTSYVAPPPAPLGRPAGLRVVRRGTSLIVGWRAVSGAMAYAVEVTTGRRHAVTTVVRGRRFTFRGVAPATPALITVTALDSRRRSAPGSVHVGGAKHRRRSS